MYYFFRFLGSLTLLIILLNCVSAQTETTRTFPIDRQTRVLIENLSGKVSVRNHADDSKNELLISYDGNQSEISAEAEKRRLELTITSDGRVDIEVEVPKWIDLEIETGAGQLSLLGEFSTVKAKSDTGTIYADTAFDNLNYKLLWTASFPRFMSDVNLAPIKEKSAGKHVIEGFAKKKTDSESLRRSMELRTARGIILVNVPPSQVPSDLAPKKLTRAAEAIIKSGDAPMVTAIRRVAPELFDKNFVFTKNRNEKPQLIEAEKRKRVVASTKRVTVQVVDRNNRAISGLQPKDFSVTERGIEREILSIDRADEPFNLLLMLDVSGSVREYVDFIRKAGRAFVNTARPEDRISIVVFNDDVQRLTGFTSDRDELSKSLDSFDAGGGTALYDALAYGLVDSLRLLKGDRTAIVILSDGDDNRSFLSLDPLIGALEESGALVYPMYVPSSLIATSGRFEGNDGLDPLRDRYLSNNLSSKARKEGKMLADVSGGVYYPINKLSQLQNAYNDIVDQLRTSYSITFKSSTDEAFENKVSARLRVRIDREGAFVKLGNVTAAESK